MRADLSGELARRGVTLGRAPEPRRDLRQVVGEPLAAAGADVAHQSRGSRRAATAHERLTPVRRVDRGAERPVRHPAGLEFLRHLVEHAHAAARVALLRANDRANVVAELLVFGETRRRTAQDPVGDVRLTAEEREVRVILGSAGRALAREPVAVGDLAPLHSRAREAEARVAPHRRSIRAQARFGLRELVDRLIDPPRGPVDEPRRVHRPRCLPRIADARGMAHRRLRGGGRVDVVA